VTLGTNLDVAFFDQSAAALREDWNALDNVSEGASSSRSTAARKHAMGYLQDFLFAPDRALAPITRLSGGERNRLLLAKLFAQPSNLLVMDEPTNDLDVETLELLEELLIDYRARCCWSRTTATSSTTSSPAAGDGRRRPRRRLRGRLHGLVAPASGAWRRTRPRCAPARCRPVPRRATQVAPPAARTAASLWLRRPAAAPKRKLGFKEQRELDQLPATIDALEKEVATATRRAQRSGDVPAGRSRGAGRKSRARRRAARLDAAYARWSELE
jgi:ATP-binding cassette subfamily F protein uup